MLEKRIQSLFKGQYDDFTVDEIIEVLKAADDAYYNDEEYLMEDSQYDAIKRYAEHLDPHHSYFIGIGSKIRGGKVRLPYPMGSLTQAYEGDVTKWVEKFKLFTEKITISDKLDGVSALVVYNRKQFQIGYSRGDGLEGADISRHLRKFTTVPSTTSDTRIVAVRGEVILSEDNFVKVLSRGLKSRSGTPYKNARNAVAGIMNAETNPDWVYEYIDFVAYEIIDPNYLSKDEQLELLNDNGFTVVRAGTVDGRRLNDHSLIEILSDRRKTSPYAIDGVVLEVNDSDLRSKINPSKETLNPEYARKYKVAAEDNTAIATVVDVHWNVSKHGYLKPRIEINPVELVGVTIKFATGFNAKFIADHKIGPGAKVEITRSGDVIPFIRETRVPSPTGPKMPPKGTWEWNETMVDAVSTEECDEQIINQIVDFFSTIDIPHLKRGNIVKLYQLGITKIEDIIMLDEEQLVDALGENGRKVYNGISEKLHNIPLYLLMGAYSTERGIGVRKMKKLQDVFGTEGLYKIDSSDLIANVEGFDIKSAEKAYLAINDFRYFFTKIHTMTTIKPDENIEGTLTGQKVVFTGFRDKDLENAIINAGGEVQSSVTSKTTIVVAVDPTSGSGKMKKARDMGIKVIGVDEMRTMV